eukprot:GILK01003430.1.p1 GENE.GILK01003430.1~~GILK01003430.1.p1  ORF type:complete len:1113 (+),score=138.28 GILK01003430.1:63-3401(+)
MNTPNEQQSAVPFSRSALSISDTADTGDSQESKQEAVVAFDMSCQQKQTFFSFTHLTHHADDNSMTVIAVWQTDSGIEFLHLDSKQELEYPEDAVFGLVRDQKADVHVAVAVAVWCNMRPPRIVEKAASDDLQWNRLRFKRDSVSAYNACQSTNESFRTLKELTEHACTKGMVVAVVSKPDDTVVQSPISKLLKYAALPQNPAFVLIPPGVNFKSDVGLFKSIWTLVSPSTGSSVTSAGKLKIDLNAVEGAFSQPYVETDAVDAFVSRVQSTSDMYYVEDSDFFSPYFAMFQSSCWGKSRLLNEVLDKHIDGIYISLLDKSSTGFPERSCLADTLLDCQTEEDFLHFIGVVLEYFLEIYNAANGDINVCREAWKNGQKDVGFKDEFVKRMRKRKSEQGYSITLPALPARVSTWLFVFDEARALLQIPGSRNSQPQGTVSAFRLLRRALAFANMPKGVVAVFTDTLSCLANFSPTKPFDPSARIPDTTLRRRNKGGDLFHPFVTLATFDILREDAPPKSLLEALEPRHLLGLGRPVWKAYYNQLMQHMVPAATKRKQIADVTSATVDFAKQKLFLSKELSWTSDEVVALLGCRLLLNVCPGDELAVKLVWCRMATCVGVALDREHILVRYPSEPILAEAAAHLWYDYRNKLGRCLETLSRLIQLGTIDAGSRGELVARLLLLLAFDRHCSQINDGSPFKYSRSVLLIDFLNSLFGTKEWDLPAALQGAAVCFTHFEFLDFVPPKDLLREALYRCAALICKKNAPAIDLVIPLLLKSGTVSAIVVQVKNHQTQFDNKWPDSATVDMTLDAAATDFPSDTPYVSLYMQLGAPRTRLCCGLYDTQFMVVAMGLSADLYPVLGSSNNGLLTHVDSLLRASRLDVYFPREPSEQAMVRYSYPLSYPDGYFEPKPKRKPPTSIRNNNKKEPAVSSYTVREVSLGTSVGIGQKLPLPSLEDVCATSTADCPCIKIADDTSIAALRLQLAEYDHFAFALSPGLVFLSPYGKGVRRVLSEDTVTVKKCLFSATNGGGSGLVYIRCGSDWSFGLHELPLEVPVQPTVEQSSSSNDASTTQRAASKRPREDEANQQSKHQKIEPASGEEEASEDVEMELSSDVI